VIAHHFVSMGKNGFLLGNVQVVGANAQVGITDQFYGFLQFLFPDVRNSQVAAFLSQGDGQGATDARGGSCDDSGFSLERHFRRER
jgi:hypothetical protein